MNLTVNPLTTTGSVTTAICQGDSYTWPANGVTYTTAQTGVTVVTGCNTATLNLTVNPLTTTGSVTTAICQGDSYTWPANGLTYTTAQTGVTVVTGCNTATLNLTVNAIDFANLQFPATETICQGGTMTAYGQVYEAGITETAGQGAGITVEFGLNSANTNPNTWTTWSPATFNVQVGNNDEYQFTTSTALTAGTYYYTFRYKLSACTTWQYGGTNNGFWNGTTNNSGVLTINPLTTTGSVTTAICQGDSYTWPANGVTYTTAQTGVTVVTGCNTATLNLTINTSPTPTGNATQTFNVVNLNDATIANLIVSPAGVIWYGSLADAQAGTNPLVSTTVLNNGATYWAVNVSGGCRSTPFGVTVTVALGSDGFDNANFSFYPNPTSNRLTISYSNAITKVTVMNLLGQILQENKSNELQVSVDLSSYPSATYLIKVEADAKSKIIKVVKKD